jgi:hypothetical protein
MQTRDIQTPFGPAQISYDGEKYLHLKFESIRLGRIPAKGVIRLVREDKVSNPSFRMHRCAPGWVDYTEYYNDLDFKRTDRDIHNRTLTAGAVKIIREKIVPWLTSFMETIAGKDLYSNSYCEKLQNDLDSYEDEIRDLQAQIEEKQKKCDDIRARLAHS